MSPRQRPRRGASEIAARAGERDAVEPLVQRFVLDGREHVVVAEIDHVQRRLGTLTPAERSIVQMLLSGMSTRAIATARRRSASTVSNQIGAIFAKMGVGSRAGLVASLSRAG